MMTRFGDAISTPELLRTVPISRAQLSYFRERYPEMLQPIMRIGLMLFWGPEAVHRLRELAGRARARRNGRPVCR